MPVRYCAEPATFDAIRGSKEGLQKGAKSSGSSPRDILNP
jgi:hypothetical protein